MIAGTMTLEGQRNSSLTSIENLNESLQTMLLPHGPTYVIVEDEGGNYIQAAGFSDRYCVESRDVYGEGFRHWRAMRPGADAGGDTKILYRNKCPEKEHPPRGCSVRVQVEDVLDFAQVASAIIHYAMSGERTEQFGWKDTTAEFLKNIDKPITTISPGTLR